MHLGIHLVYKRLPFSWPLAPTTAWTGPTVGSTGTICKHTEEGYTQNQTQHKGKQQAC